MSSGPEPPANPYQPPAAPSEPPAGPGARTARRWVLPVATGGALVGGVLLGLALGLLLDSSGSSDGAAPTGNAAELTCQLNARWDGREAAEGLERDGLSDGLMGGSDVTILQAIAAAAVVAGNEDDRYTALGESGQGLFSGVTTLNIGLVHESLDQLERECLALDF